MLATVELTRQAAGFSAARFRLGALYSLTVKTVPQLIMGLKIRRSELNIDLILGSNMDLLYKLKNMEVDAMLVSLDESTHDPDCEHLALFSDDIFLAVPTDSPFAEHPEVDLGDLREATFITLTQGFATHRDGIRVFQQAGFEPKVAMQVNDIFTLLSMVSSGVGYALLPGRIAAVYENRVRLIPLQSRYRMQQHIGIVFSQVQTARSQPARAVGRVPDVHQPAAGTDDLTLALYEKSSSEGQARQKQARKRSLRVVNEHSEPVFNEASPSAATFSTEPSRRWRAR